MAARRKCVLIIADGLGDLPIPELDGQTPLEAARTPFLDRFASAGRCGLVDPLRPGKIPNTHSGCGLLLGLVPEHVKRLKRGPVEAAGAGRRLGPGEIAVRANFASVEVRDGSMLVIDRRAGRISDGTAELAAVLQDVDLGDGVSATLISTDQHRAALVMTGPGLEAAISDTDPGDVPLPAPLAACLARSPGAEWTAAKIDRFVAVAHSRLENHPVNIRRRAMRLPPANAVITRGAGAWFSVDNILERRGMKVSVVAGCNTVTGLGRLLGFQTINDPRFTASVDTDVQAKMETAVAALENHDLVYVHVKAPDICAHDLQPLVKRDIIERLDASMECLARAGCVVAVTADHTTDSNTGFHSANPVPSLIFNPGESPGKTPVKFGETACLAGALPRQTSHIYLQEVVRAMGW
jgi:2,3-bisphosphoglycerate-independent phosphoglycerate mutase